MNYKTLNNIRTSESFGQGAYLSGNPSARQSPLVTSQGIWSSLVLLGLLVVGALSAMGF